MLVVSSRQRSGMQLNTTMLRTGPPTMDYLTPNVNSVEAEKLRFRCVE